MQPNPRTAERYIHPQRVAPLVALTNSPPATGTPITNQTLARNHGLPPPVHVWPIAPADAVYSVDDHEQEPVTAVITASTGILPHPASRTPVAPAMHRGDADDLPVYRLR